MSVYLKNIRKQTKYNSKKVENEFGKFDSKKEFLRYIDLLDKQRRGLIKDLQKQVRYEIVPSIKIVVEKPLKTKTKLVERVDESARHYTCDFQYTLTSSGQTIIEDVKSKITAKIRDYGLRRHLMKWLIKRMNEKEGWERYVFKEVVY